MDDIDSASASGDDKKDKDKEPPEVKSLTQWIKAVLRLVRSAADAGRWQLPEILAHLEYMGSIVDFAAQYKWSAVIRYDNAFRLQMHNGHIGQWTDWSQHLFTQCFVLGEQRLHVPQPRKREPKAKREPKKRTRKPAGGGKGSALTRYVSDVDWADETLEHKEKDGEQLCFKFQRTGKCADKDGDCAYCHDKFCGICGEEGHIARNCPEAK